MNTLELKESIIQYANTLAKKYEQSKDIPSDYFEPGVMENMDKFDGQFNNDCVNLSVEVSGTKYEGRSEIIEDLSVDDVLEIQRDFNNQFDPYCLKVVKIPNNDLGFITSDLSKLISPLLDNRNIKIENVKYTYVEKLLERSRYACKAVLFISFDIRFLNI